MGIFKRALLSIVRQPVKSLILLVTVAILGTLIAGAVAMKQGLIATQRAVTDKMKILAGVSIKIDEKMTNEQIINMIRNTPNLDDKTVEQITSLPQVQNYEMRKGINLSSYKLISKEMGAGTGRPISLQIISAKDGHSLDYSAGKLEVVGGRWLNAEDESSPLNPIVISQEFANDNKFTVGSKFTMDNYVMDDSKSQTANSVTEYADAQKKVGEVTFTVIGIFKYQDMYSISSSGQLTVSTKYYTLVAYTSKAAIDSVIAQTNEEYRKINGPNAGNYISSTPGFTIWLKDRAGVQAFNDAVTAILPSPYVVYTAVDMYDKTLSPLQNLDWIVNLIIVASVAATVAVLGLVVALVLRSRKVEIGILASLGERKKKIATQMVAEILLIAVLGISVAAFAGTQVAKGVSAGMMKGQVTSLLQNTQNGEYNYDANILHDISEGGEVSLGADTIILIYVVGLLTAGAAAALPVFFTLRQNPKDILMTAA